MKKDKSSTEDEESAKDEDLDIAATPGLDDKPPKSGRNGRKPYTNYKVIDYYSHLKIK